MDTALRSVISCPVASSILFHKNPISRKKLKITKPSLGDHLMASKVVLASFNIDVSLVANDLETPESQVSYGMFGTFMSGELYIATKSYVIKSPP